MLISKGEAGELLLNLENIMKCRRSRYYISKFFNKEN